MQNIRGALMGQALLAKYGEYFEALVDLIIERPKTGHFDAEIHYPYSDHWEEFCRECWTHLVTNCGLSFQMSYGRYGGKAKGEPDFITARVWWN